MVDMTPGQANRAYNQHRDDMRNRVFGLGTNVGRSAEFSTGHADARPDKFSPAKEKWTEQELRTVEDERERRLRE